MHCIVVMRRRRCWKSHAIEPNEQGHSQCPPHDLKTEYSCFQASIFSVFCMIFLDISTILSVVLDLHTHSSGSMEKIFYSFGQKRNFGCIGIQ